MAHVAPWQVWRQRLTLCLFLLVISALGVQAEWVDLLLEFSQVAVQCFFEQAALLGRQGAGKPFAGGGELQALEYRHFVRELVDHRLFECSIMLALSNQRVLRSELRIMFGLQVLQQLLHLRVQRNELLRTDHGR